MLRVRFNKPTHAARRTYQPGEEADFSVALANECVALGVAEIIGECEQAADGKPKRAKKNNRDILPLNDVPAS